MPPVRAPASLSHGRVDNEDTQLASLGCDSGAMRPDRAPTLGPSAPAIQPGQ